MSRGDIWIVAGGGDYTGKPRPVVILQDDAFDALDSVTVAGFTTHPPDAPLFRIAIEPSDLNGLDPGSQVMVDKLTTVRRTRLGQRIGRLSDEDMVRVGRALLVFLGLAGSPRPR